LFYIIVKILQKEEALLWMIAEMSGGMFVFSFGTFRE